LIFKNRLLPPAEFIEGQEGGEGAKQQTMKHSIFLLLIILSFSSCKKFLDKKPDKALVVPASIADLQGLLDFNSRMNLNCTSLGEVSADNYYLVDATWTALSVIEKNAYIWQDDIYSIGGPTLNDWSKAYEPVYYANVVLEHIDKIQRNTQNAVAWDNVKGSALLFRAKSFLQSVFIWAKAYDSATASSDWGIPLRLNSDFNEISVRATVQQSYEQVIADLKEAAPLLPVTPQHVMRPSRPAAYALLARTYLAMRQYDSCFRYADLSLQLNNQLLDYNSLNASATFPVQRFNPEVIMHSIMPVRYLDLSNSRARIDSALYNSYVSDDLRKTVFFKDNGDGSFAFKGSYDNSTSLFNGIAVDEVYLMRAECLARKGNTQSALNDLDTLMEKRWKSGTFVPFSAMNAQQALNLILDERRKELIFRDLRWMDIKRLNKEGASITIKRFLNNQLFQLPPDDNRYALPLPEDIINLTGMPQNPR
jgi:tetratricopeptide (TPR) repeat protein